MCVEMNMNENSTLCQSNYCERKLNVIFDVEVFFSIYFVLIFNLIKPDLLSQLLI